MKYFTILLFIGMLAGCSYTTIFLKHPETGEIAKCGPYRIWSFTGPIGTSANELREIKCIENFEAVGYLRMPD